jgi:two-component system sensor histidine kinase UhpB
VGTNGRNAVSVTSERAIQAEPRAFEALIRKQVVWINLFSDNGAPHVSAPSETRPPTLSAEVVGRVRVTMSPTNMLARQLRRFRIELAIAALGLAASGLLAWFLARSLTVPLREAIGVLRRIRGGEYRVQLPATTGGEIGELQASIGEMSVALEHSKQDLENKVAERTRDLLASRNEALRADADKRKLIQKVNNIIEDERKSIALEIHDELNASLIAVRLESQTIQHLAAKAVPGPEIDQIRAKAQSITKLALDLYANGRRLVRRLRPEVLDMLGLHGAVEEMVGHYRNSGVLVEFDSDGDFAHLGNDLAISAYRIVQEALSNVMKHAHAGVVRVSLALSDAGTGGDGALRIEVQDDGAGFDTAGASEGIGIIGMRERVAALGGRMDVLSTPGEGTLVAIVLPLAPMTADH